MTDLQAAESRTAAPAPARSEGGSLPPAAAPARREPFWLLGMSTLSLFVFYYLLRTDTVGVFAEGRGWQVVVPSTLSPAWHYVASAVVLAVIPVVVARKLTGLSLSELGLGVGEWKIGVPLVLIGIPLAILSGKIGSAAPPMQAVYPLDPTQTADFASFVPYALLQFLYYAAWEVLFRGVLLFGLRGGLGAGTANMTQTSLSVTAHFGRAQAETFSAFPAGLFFGFVTLRLRSLWYIAIIHWIVGTSSDWFILASRG